MKKKRIWEIVGNCCVGTLLFPPLAIITLPLLIVAKHQAEKKPNNGTP